MRPTTILVKRFEENPLIVPPDVPWLKIYPPRWRAVFNCGVTYDQRDHLFKMLFRGGARIFAQVGLAISRDGKKWAVNSEPVLTFPKHFFWQGHTLAGIEDPRLVWWINGYHYIFATTCSIQYYLSGGRYGQLGIWRTKNFLDFEWVGSPFGGESKNAAIFHEPINGQTYLLYRRYPDIWMCQTDDLSLKSNWGGHQRLLSAEQIYHDPLTGQKPSKIGIAGPPIKTDKGWLLIFHAKYGGLSMQSFLYTLGLMVLDLYDPGKIIYFHPSPILRPEKPEEIYGCTPNVCFSCATVDYQDKIYLYWGGADTVVCGGFLNKSDLPMCY